MRQQEIKLESEADQSMRVSRKDFFLSIDGESVGVGGN